MWKLRRTVQSVITHEKHHVMWYYFDPYKVAAVYHVVCIPYGEVMKLFCSRVRCLSSQQLVYSNTRHQYILYHYTTIQNPTKLSKNRMRNIISNAKFQYAI